MHKGLELGRRSGGWLREWLGDKPDQQSGWPCGKSHENPAGRGALRKEIATRAGFDAARVFMYGGGATDYPTGYKGQRGKSR
jgi:hypothetical protein